jgi:hypothetical protein
MNSQDDQLLAIIQRAEMPSDAVAALCTSDSVEVRSFDESYLRFLDQQIVAKARGVEWDGLYAARRRNLAEYAGVPLTVVSVTNETTHYSVKIEPESGTVVHWERIAQDGFDYLGK